jgi:hypothetical protein
MSEERSVKAWIDDGGVLLCASAMCFACHREGKCVPMALVELDTIQSLTAQLAKMQQALNHSNTVCLDALDREKALTAQLGEAREALEESRDALLDVAPCYTCRSRKGVIECRPGECEENCYYANIARKGREVLSRTNSSALARYKAMEEVAKAVVEVKGDIANYCCMCACHDICDTCRVTRFRQALTKLQEVPHDPTD